MTCYHDCQWPVPGDHFTSDLWAHDWNLLKILIVVNVTVMIKSHYSDVIMGSMASEIISLTIVYSTVYWGADQRKHQSSASLAFVRGIHRWPAQMASNAENASIWWRHHEVWRSCTSRDRRAIQACVFFMYGWHFYIIWNISSYRFAIGLRTVLFLHEDGGILQTVLQDYFPKWKQSKFRSISFDCRVIESHWKISFSLHHGLHAQQQIIT